MRRFLLAGLSAAALLSVGAFASAQAAPVGEMVRHDTARSAEPARQVEQVDYRYGGHRYHHRRWDHGRWRYY